MSVQIYQHHLHFVFQSIKGDSVYPYFVLQTLHYTTLSIITLGFSNSFYVANLRQNKFLMFVVHHIIALLRIYYWSGSFSYNWFKVSIVKFSSFLGFHQLILTFCKIFLSYILYKLSHSVYDFSVLLVLLKYSKSNLSTFWFLEGENIKEFQ